MFKNNTKFSIMTPTGFEKFKGIQIKNVKEMYTFEFDDGTQIKASGKHLFLTQNGFKKSKDVSIYDDLSGKKIKNIIKEDGDFEVYDPVGVDKHSTYISNGIVSHNTEFLGSVNTLIAPQMLKKLVSKSPIFSKDGLDVYSHPEQGHTYFLSADVGKGRGMDYSAFSIIDITEYPYKQVAKFRNNNLSHLVYPSEIERLAKAYNEALVLIELNDAGTEVANILYQELEYENIYSCSRGSGKYDMGLIQTKATKRTGCSNIKELIESQKLIIYDIDTIMEFSTFVKKQKANGNITFEADTGCHDDLVMGLSNFGWATQQEYFKDLTDQNLRKNILLDRASEIESHEAPFGYISNGIEDDDVDDEEEGDDGFSEWFNR